MKWKVNQTYLDKGNWRDPEDQFMCYLHNGHKTIANSGGIRWQNFVNINPIEQQTKHKIPPYIVLLTARTSVAWDNPWSDIVNYSSGQLIYWGDAKFSTANKSWSNFRGNKLLWSINLLRLDNKKNLLPPFLHFTKSKSGKVKFTGLCRMRDCQLEWFDENGEPVQNLRVIFDILDIEELDVEWLKNRSLVETDNDLIRGAPKVWKDAINGKSKLIQTWKSEIRSQKDQFPETNKDDLKIINQINSLEPFQFEKLSVSIIELFPEIITGLIHKVQQTKLTGDGGIDFFGFFRLPEPIDYLIKFKGESKKWRKAVTPKDVSRLVARLNRGEYGLFFTTSWYSKQAQEEVLKDNYPVKLFSGIDIINILKRSNKITNGSINKEWLRLVLK